MVDAKDHVHPGNSHVFFGSFHPSIATKELLPELSNFVCRTFAASCIIQSTIQKAPFGTNMLIRHGLTYQDTEALS